jgi:transmembrane sensor
LTWITRLTSGEATQDDAEALASWRQRSAEHEAAFRDQAKLWRDMGHALEIERASKPAFSRRAVLTGAGVAAGLAGVVAYSSGFMPSIWSRRPDYVTSTGRQLTVTLPDSSRAFLDAGSSMSLDFNGEKRGVELESGAAVFEVAAHTTGPFTVNVGAGKLETAEGSFSVSLDTDDVSVQCLSKKVMVHCCGSQLLAEGHALTYSEDGLGSVSDFDVATAAAWRRGLLVFENRTLEDIVLDLNRHRPGRVIIARPSLKTLRMSGVFHLNRPDEILAQLTQTLHVESVHLIGGVVILI